MRNAIATQRSTIGSCSLAGISAALVGGLVLAATTPASGAERAGSLPSESTRSIAVAQSQSPDDVPRQKPSRKKESWLGHLPAEARAQLPLIDAAQDFQAVMDAGDAGFGALAIDQANSSLVVYYKGDLPAHLSAEVAQAEASGVSVEVRPSAFSDEEAQAEIARLLSDDQIVSQLAVSSIHPDFEGQALTVRVAPESTPPSIERNNVESLEAPQSGDVLEGPAAEELLAEVTPFSTNLEIEERIEETPAAGWRWEDSPPPFYGGSNIRREKLGLTFTRCTSAFASRNAAATVKVMWTARHCGANETWKSGQTEGIVGVANLVIADSDTMGIVTSLYTTPYTGRMWFGAHNTTSNVNVAGSGRPVLNSLVCTNGSFSGGDCNQRVTAVGAQSAGYPWGTGTYFETTHTTGTQAVGQGDSGGPVYVAGSNGAIGQGIISHILTRQGQNTAICVGVQQNGRTCSNVARHAELYRYLNTTGQILISSPTLSVRSGK